MNLKPVIDAILDEYTLALEGHHGVGHWARVLENGLRLSEQTGACVEVVSLFAVLHDSRRINEVTDPKHGPRAAQFASQLRGTVFELDDKKFKLLFRACEGHTSERTHPDLTIQTCWDSDRLDLGRVGITPYPDKLCTAAAKTKSMIQWADGRASFHVVPAFVLNDWGIDLKNRSNYM
ncbi:MAG: hypothetical protein JNL58_28840 [Planctomyces sp.]|nr:hypothetical protein [Planctomyces sp.]